MRPGRRRDPGVVEFELLAEDEEHEAHEAAVVVGDAPDGEAPAIQPSVLTVAARRTWAWLRARTPRELVAGVVVTTLAVTAAVTAGAAAGTRREQERAARIAAAPGGVADLSSPVEERWAVDFPGLASDTWGIAAIPLTVLDAGVLVVAEPVGIVHRLRAEDGWDLVYGGGGDGAVVMLSSGDDVELTGWDLHGVDLETGEVLWTHPHEQRTLQCDNTVRSTWVHSPALVSVGATQRLVCLVGEGADAVFRAIDPDGGVERWQPGEMLEHTRIALGVDGVAWFADRVDDVAAAASAEVQAPPAASDDPPADLRVRAVDLDSGEVLWERVVPADPRQGSCLVWGDGDQPVRDRRDLGLWTLENGNAVVLWGCGVDHAAVTAEGEVTRGERWGWEFVPLDGGGTVRPSLPLEHGITFGQAVVDDHGELLRAATGEVLIPWTTDGRGAVDLRTPAAERGGGGHIFWREGADLVAIGAQGEEAWRAGVEQRIGSVVARVGDVVVLHTWRSAGRGPHLLALDQRTGEARWDVPMAGGEGVWGDSPTLIGGAWTDGSVLVVATPGGLWSPHARMAEQDVTWTAYDVRTGAVVWQEVMPPQETPGDWCFAASGRLLCQRAGRISRIA